MPITKADLKRWEKEKDADKFIQILKYSDVGKNQDLIIHALNVLSNIQDPKEMALTVAKLRNTTEEVRNAVFELLNRIGPKSVDYLAEIAESDEVDDETCYEAFKILRSRTDDAVVRIFLKFLVKGIYKSGIRDYVVVNHLIESVGQYVQSSDPRMRFAAISALLGYNNNRAVAAIARSALKDDDVQVRALALQCFYNNPDDEITDLLLEALKDEDLKVQTRAIRFLGYREDERAAKYLLPYAVDKSSYLRSEALRSLHDIPSQETLKSLSVIFLDEKEVSEIRGQALEALRLCKDDGCDDFLLSIVQGEFPLYYKVTAVDLLGYRQAVSCLDSLLKIITYQSYKPLNLSIIFALGQMEDERALLPLIGFLNSDDYSTKVKDEIICALGKIGDIRAVKPIICAITENNDHEESVIKALKEILEPQSISSYMEEHPAEKGSVLAEGYDKLKEVLGRKQSLADWSLSE